MKFNHNVLISISGMIWFAAGCYLLPLGLSLLMESVKNPDIYDPVLSTLSPYLGGFEQVSVVLVAIALFVGYCKSKYVLSKSVNRTIIRIRSLPNPSHILSIYSPAYLLLLALMMFLGVMIKVLGLANGIRGPIDIAIGTALINGAMQFFRVAKLRYA